MYYMFELKKIVNDNTNRFLQVLSREERELAIWGSMYQNNQLDKTNGVKWRDVTIRNTGLTNSNICSLG